MTLGTNTTELRWKQRQYLFEQSQDVEREEAQAGRRQQAGLLDGQRRLPVRRQRVDGGVGHGVSGVAQAGCHRAIHSWKQTQTSGFHETQHFSIEFPENRISSEFGNNYGLPSSEFLFN